MDKIERVARKASFVSLVVGALIWLFAPEVFAARSGSSPAYFSAEIKPSVAISLYYPMDGSGNIIIGGVTPSKAGATTASGSDLHVTGYSNDSAGFSIRMNAVSNALSTADGHTIESIAYPDCYALGQIPVNHWGVAWSTNSMSYYCGLSGNLPIEISHTTSGGSGTVYVNAGAKLDLNTTPGLYMATLNFSIVGNIAEGDVANISQLTYMQDFASLTAASRTAVKNSMTTGTQYQLKDSRDGKTYYIAKLSDGNVWMTQNLDHNIVAATNFYTPQNTDISANWTPSRATYQTGYYYWIGGAPSSPESYDPGDLCWDGNSNGDLNSTCSDRHFHIGNFYNWPAAVASNSAGLVQTGYDQSICPAGWTLPSSYSGVYGDSNSPLFSDLVSGKSFAELVASPTLFTVTGYWSYGNRYNTLVGYYWSRVVETDNAYALELSPGGVNPDSPIPRGYGVAVRCVAR